MPAGLCCAAQAAGDLGKPLIVNVVSKSTGQTTQRCGVCDIVPSCKNPNKTVFSFRFLKKQDCNLAGGKCTPTAAGIAQYNTQIPIAAAAGEAFAYTTPLNILSPVAIPAARRIGYVLPPS
jgi:hypothetical protein